MAFPDSPVLDVFTRADGVAGDNWSSPWWGDPVTFNVVSNQGAAGGANATAALWQTVMSPDFEVYFDVPVLEGLSKSIRLLFVLDSSPTLGAAPDGYVLRVQDHGSVWTVYRLAAGVETALGTLTAAGTSNGDGLGFRRVGNTLEGFYKAGAGSYASKGTVVDDAWQNLPGRIGFELPDNTVRIDGFGGGWPLRPKIDLSRNPQAAVRRAALRPG